MARLKERHRNWIFGYPSDGCDWQAYLSQSAAIHNPGIKRRSLTQSPFIPGHAVDSSCALSGQARTVLILLRLWNAHHTGVMDSNNCWYFHACVDITFAAPRSVDSLSDGGSSAHARW
jgi:hypothetical protein